MVFAIGWIGTGFTPLWANVQTLITLVIAAPGGYLLYRSATSLVPLYRFKSEPAKSS